MGTVAGRPGCSLAVRTARQQPSSAGEKRLRTCSASNTRSLSPQSLCVLRNQSAPPAGIIYLGRLAATTRSQDEDRRSGERKFLIVSHSSAREFYSQQESKNTLAVPSQAIILCD
jgi:hypothetical protein